MSEQIKISKKARQHVREMLSDYPQMKGEMAELRHSLMAVAEDGSNQFSVFEADTVIKIVSHEQIHFRSLALKVIEEVIGKATSETRAIIEFRYFNKEPLSWVAISLKDEVRYSEDNCRKLEKKVVDEIAKRLGW